MVEKLPGSKYHVHELEVFTKERRPQMEASLYMNKILSPAIGEVASN